MLSTEDFYFFISFLIYSHIFKLCRDILPVEKRHTLTPADIFIDDLCDDINDILYEKLSFQYGDESTTKIIQIIKSFNFTIDEILEIQYTLDLSLISPEVIDNGFEDDDLKALRENFINLDTMKCETEYHQILKEIFQSRRDLITSLLSIQDKKLNENKNNIELEEEKIN